MFLFLSKLTLKSYHTLVPALRTGRTDLLVCSPIITKLSNDLPEFPYKMRSSGFGASTRIYSQFVKLSLCFGNCTYVCLSVCLSACLIFSSSLQASGAYCAPRAGTAGGQKLQYM